MVREQGSPGWHRYRYLSASDGSGCRSRGGVSLEPLVPTAACRCRSRDARALRLEAGKGRKAQTFFFFFFLFIFPLLVSSGKWNCHDLDFWRSG